VADVDASVDAALASRVEELLRRHDPAAALVSFDRLAGGHSGVSHLAEAESGRGRHRVVVRSSPPGRPAAGRHDVVRQARVMAALAGRLPVPHVYGSADVAPDGTGAFFVVEFVSGTVTEPVIEPPAPGESADLVSASWDHAISTLATLHTVEAAAVGLADPARSPHEELQIWVATFKASRFQYPRIDPLLDRLERTAPTATTAAIVHGDYRLGNLIRDGGRPKAIIDWEIWSVGHPLIDLGWLVQFTDPAAFPGIGRAVDGTPSADQVVAAYLDRSGTPEDSLQWFLALGAFKLAAIQAHNQRRHLDGRYHDPYQELLGPSITSLLDAAGERLGAATAP
jgi:aminoglycoside phosphotransferase (APT) family kinase protein